METKRESDRKGNKKTGMKRKMTKLKQRGKREIEAERETKIKTERERETGTERNGREMR